MEYLYYIWMTLYDMIKYNRIHDMTPGETSRCIHMYSTLYFIIVHIRIQYNIYILTKNHFRFGQLKYYSYIATYI